MDAYLVFLRLVHIIGGVAWAGGAFMLAVFIEPTVRASGPEGGRFMQGLLQKKLLAYLLSTGGLAVLSGLLLLEQVSGTFNVDYLSSSTGVSFVVGGLFGLVAFLIAMFMGRPAIKKMSALGAAVAQGGGAPNSEQMSEMGVLQGKVRLAARLVAGLLIVALIGMSAARYL